MGTPVAGSEPDDIRVGQKAVELGLITELQLKDVLARMGQAPAPVSLSATLVDLGLLTNRQLMDLTADTSVVRKKFGKYTIVRQLGRGGMGVVYEAIDADLGRPVALKMLLPSQQADPQEAAREEDRFVREARMCANLPKHPGIVGVYESGIHQGRRFISMEYVEGCHFGEWCKKSSGGLRAQIGIIRDAAIAVDHAHSHGIIHRDLKPANVLIDTQGKPHVSDFGLARHTRVDASLTLTGDGKVMGTPAYISPEQAAGKKTVDRRTDVWSLGVMLYELLAGRTPFRGETPIDIMMKTVQNPVTPPSTVAKAAGRRAVDRTLENICMRALAKEPQDRYPNAKRLADDLTRWLAGQTVDVTAPSRKSGPIRTWMIAGAVAGLAALAFFLSSGSGSAEKDAAQRSSRVEEFVSQGHRLLALGKYTDALVAFSHASELDPANKAATAGRQEAERKIMAAAAAKVAPPPPAPPPAAPSPAAGSGLERAREFARTNPKDLQGQIRNWKEVLAAAAGGPGAAEARRELDALRTRQTQAMTGEFEELDHAIDALREAESFGAARDILKQSAKRHEEAEWQDAVEQRKNTLQQAVTAVFSPLKAQALEAKANDKAKQVDEIRARVGRWKYPEFSVELDEALSKVSPVPAPAVPAPAPDPAPTVGLPELPPLLGHGSGVSAAAFSPDAKTLISCSFDNTVRFWDVSAKTEKMKLVEGILPRSVAYSSDGKWLAAGLLDGSIRIWDYPKLQARTFSGHTLQVLGLAFAPDSRVLASASTDGSVRLWDCASGTQKSQLDGHAKGAMSLAWSPDRKLLAVGTADREIRLWEIPAGRERRTLRDGIRATTLALGFSPNGKQLASAGEDPPVLVWDVDSGRHRELAGHTKEVRGVAWSPDGVWLVSSSSDATLRLWDAATGQSRALVTDPSAFFGATFSRKGDVIAGCSGEGSIRFWDLNPLRTKKSPKD